MTQKENEARIASLEAQIAKFGYWQEIADINGEPAVSEHYSDLVRECEEELTFIKKQNSFLEA